mgnify:FL=1
MYKVIIVNDDNETTIHHPNGIKLETGVIKKELNKIDSFRFNILPNNPGYHLLKPLKTLIKVWNMKEFRYEFEGRILKPTQRMDSDGIFGASYTCEGELAYLHDSQQRHLEFRGTPRELLETIIQYHNSQVED